MSIKQLSVFAENKKGSLVKVVRTLSDAGIDIRSICVADTENFGILRIIAKDTEKALEAVQRAGFTARVRPVVAIAIDDEPGALSNALTLLSDAGINLEYMYSIINADSKKAYMVLRVDDNAHAEKVISENGITVLSQETVYR